MHSQRKLKKNYAKHNWMQNNSFTMWFMTSDSTKSQFYLKRGKPYSFFVIRRIFVLNSEDSTYECCFFFFWGFNLFVDYVVLTNTRKRHLKWSWESFDKYFPWSLVLLIASTFVCSKCWPRPQPQLIHSWITSALLPTSHHSNK